jgi:Holliday junction DNA helicase RuvB
VVEPFLLKIGFLNRTRSGRVATERAYAHLGLEFKRPLIQEPLF